MQLYSVHKDANGIDRFLMLVRQSGNVVALDPDTHKFDVWSRRKDNEYGPNPDALVIRQEEIGHAIEELEDQNTPEQLTGLKRPSSLNDILSMRKPDPEPVQAVAQPYADEEIDDSESDEGVEEAMDDDMESGFIEEPTDEDDPSLPETENDISAGDEDTSVYAYEAVEHAALHEAAQTISNAKKDRILKVVQETLGTDLTDVSDILLMLSETAELKKSLSAILASLNIEVSMTTVSRDYKVTPKTIRFAADRTENLENYRRGVAQMMVRVSEILVALGKTDELEQTVKMLEGNLDVEKRNAVAAAARMQQENETLRAKLSPQSLIAARFIVFWKSEGNETRYLTVEAGAKNAAVTDANRHMQDTIPFEAATKRCGASAKQNEAHKFTSLESAQNQVARLTKWAKNCDFFEGKAPDLSIARLGLDIVG